MESNSRKQMTPEEARASATEYFKHHTFNDVLEKFEKYKGPKIPFDFENGCFVILDPSQLGENYP